MNEIIGRASAHPAGEPETALAVHASEEEELVIDTPGGRYRASFDERTPVSPPGPLVFFAQFPQASGRFEALCQDAPLVSGSPNAYAAREGVGTLVLGILAGHWRYAHLSALRFDTVAPGLLGLGALVSEDSVRRGLRRIDQITGRQWLSGHLRQSWREFLRTPWILDVDTTIKPIYGRQEGARLGYNPQKPGRPSHALHPYWISTLRLCLDVGGIRVTRTRPATGWTICGRCWSNCPRSGGRTCCAAIAATTRRRVCSGPKPAANVICSRCVGPRGRGRPGV